MFDHNQPLQVSPRFDDVPSAVWDLLAVIGTILGTIFAFRGSELLRLAFFLFGMFVGGVLCELVLNQIDSIDPKVWLISELSAAFLVGILVDQVFTLAKFALVLGLGVIFAGIFNQYGLAFMDSIPPTLFYIVICMALLLSALLAYFVFEFTVKLSTSFSGGVLVLLCLSRLMRSDLSITEMWVDPKVLLKCNNEACWFPFTFGTVIFLSGLAFQLNCCSCLDHVEADRVAIDNRTLLDNEVL